MSSDLFEAVLRAARSERPMAAMSGSSVAVQLVEYLASVLVGELAAWKVCQRVVWLGDSAVVHSAVCSAACSAGYSAGYSAVS